MSFNVCGWEALIERGRIPGRLRPLDLEGIWDRVGVWVLHGSRLLGAPHVVVLLEEHIILHSPLLQLHVQTAPVDGHHLADAADPQGGV